MNERWLPAPGHEGLYEVSDLGRVKRLASAYRNSMGVVHLPERMVPPTNTNGYLVVNLWRDNKPRRWLVHRLVMAAFERPSDLSVDHINGQKSDNRLSNLRYCTLRENTLAQHADGRARFVNGSRNGKSKLTEADIPIVRTMIAEGRSSAEVAKHLGVSKGAIQAVREGRTWAHVA